MGESAAVTEVIGLLRRTASAATDTARCGATLDADARRAVLAEIDRAEGALTSARATLLLAERESGAWRGSGDASFAAWRGRVSRGGVRAGAADERRADALATVPAMAEAAASGEVSVAHVDVVGRAVGQASSAVRAALEAPEGQERVLQLASRLDAGRFATAMARYAAAVDAGQLERGHQAQRAARFLHLADAADGTRISGRLDRMAGHRLRLALEALSPRPAADDDREPAQRRADALEAMADRLLGLPDVVPGAAVRPHVSFLMTEDTWAALRAMRRASEEPAAPAETDGAAESVHLAEPLTLVEPVTLEDGTPVPMSEVARALCDCEFTRIVLDARSEPVDLGRTARTYTGVQRRAVLARDGACAWEGCGLAPRWLEVHHGHWWDRDDGPTSVENGVAICAFHHGEVHRRDLRIRRVQLDPAEVGATSRRVGYLLTTPDGRVVAGRTQASEAPGPAGSAGRPPRRELGEPPETGVDEPPGTGVGEPPGTEADEPPGIEADEPPCRDDVTARWVEGELPLAV